MPDACGCVWYEGSSQCNKNSLLFEEGSLLYTWMWPSPVAADAVTNCVAPTTIVPPS